MAGASDNAFGSDILSFYLKNYGYIPPNAYGIPSGEPALMGGNQGILNDRPIVNPSGVLSASQPDTGARRNTAPLAPPPSRQIDNNEMLMRVGGAMVGGAQDGGLNAIGKASEMYGSIQDYNRSRALEDYNAAVMANLRGAQAQKAMNAGKKGTDSPSNASKMASADVVNDAGARALDIIQNDINNEDFLNDFFTGGTGMAGLYAGLPNTTAKKLANLLETIKGNAGFDKLQAMREASPTGGALGQVSEMELRQLNAAFGNLDQTNSPEELRYNLMNLLHVYNNIIHGVGNHNIPAPRDMDLSGNSNPAANNSSLNDADAIVGIN